MTNPPRRRVTAKTNPKTAENAVGDDTKMLLTMLQQMRDDFRDEREASRQSRAKLHERMDEVANDVGDIKGDIRILGEVDGQVRGELQALKDTVETHHADTKPTVDAWRDLMKNGRRVSWIFSIAGITTIGGLVGALNGAFDWIGSLLMKMRGL
jgi:hypothetical protein